jgi:hypothetical protein
MLNKVYYNGLTYEALQTIEQWKVSNPLIIPEPDYSHRMNPLDFCYWLQGLMEVGNPKTLDETQVQHIKNHLNMVFENKAGLVEQVIYASC